MARKSPAGKSFRGRISNKMVAAFTLVIICLVIILTSFSYLRMKSILRDNFVTNGNKDLTYLEQVFENYIDHIDKQLLTFRMDSRFMNILKFGSREYADLNYIQNHLVNIFYTRQDIESIFFYIPFSETSFYTNQSVSTFNTSPDTARIESQDWFLNAVQPIRYSSVIMPDSEIDDVLPNTAKTFIGFSRALIRIEDRVPIGVLYLKLNQKAEDFVTKNIVNYERDEFVGIFDRNNNPLYLSNRDFYTGQSEAFSLLLKEDTASGESLIWQDKYLTLNHISGKTGWTYVKLISVEYLNQEAITARNIILLLSSVFIIIFILIVILLSRAITRPIIVLSDQMRKVGDTNTNIKLEVRGNDEISYLSHQFNKMLDKLDSLILDKYKSRISEQRARMLALEAQVNPHFLYNSLQAISAQALMADNQNVAQMLDSLAFTLRYSIKAGNVVTVSSEIQNVENYLQLQKARFEERLVYCINIGEDIKEIMLPKLSLQILVENAIRHGLEKMERPVTIQITGMIANGECRLTVSDDGPGISESKRFDLEKLMNNYDFDSDENSSIGLVNLLQRLHHIYGNEKAALEIESNANTGTTVHILIRNI